MTEVSLHSFSSGQNHEGIPMKRFVLLFASLVLASQVIGCGGGTTTTNPASDDPSQWGEAKKAEAKLQADWEARAASPVKAAKKKGP
jgi:hypothetical protein